MKTFPAGAPKMGTKFRMPTSENLVPIRVDVEVEGQRFKDTFTWNPTDPDSEVVVFARRTVKDLKLPPAFITPIAQSIQSQLTEFRSYEGQEMNTGEKILPLKLDLRVNNTVIRDQFLWPCPRMKSGLTQGWNSKFLNATEERLSTLNDINNFESDPEEFARTFCKDLDIGDPEAGPAIAVAIRQQLYEVATQSVTSARETRVGKKGRRERGIEHVSASKLGGAAFDSVKLFGPKSSVIRKRKEWDLYEPIIDILSAEEVEALDAKEERYARLKKRPDD